jgi:hypothetical protein
VFLVFLVFLPPGSGSAMPGRTRGPVHRHRAPSRRR